MLPGGARLGPYEIVTPLGAGGMGEVYRARDTRLGREVAVKVLPEAIAADVHALARFEAEARAVAALSHPHILAIHDFGREDGTAYAVMELLEGTTLRERLAEGPLPVRKALELARDVAQGLAAAHEKGIVHRDLKPENLFVTRGGRVKILDFGLARRTAPASEADTRSPTQEQLTSPGTVLGTVLYMSPEQVRGLPADARSDLFSFGAVLYEMLAGRPAFRRATAAETMTAILREDAPELAPQGAPVPPALERIVRHCLEKEPDERFRSAHDLAFALEAVSGSTGASAVAGPAARSGARFRLWPALALTGLLCLALGAALGRALTPRSAEAFVSVKPLTHSGSDLEPAVSPDGKTIAFTSTRDGTSRIWLKQLTTGEEVALSEGPDSMPRFSPDGTQLLFTRGRKVIGILGTFAETTTDLYRMPLLGGAPRKVASAAGDADWSPDGKSIVFVRMLAAAPGIESGLYLVSPEGGEPRRLASGDGRYLGAPRFSPDGRSIAVLSAPPLGNVTPRFDVVSLDGARRTFEVPPSLGAASGPVWEDAGRSVGYVQSMIVRFGSSRLMRHDLKTGRATPLLGLPFETNVLDTLPDGRFVVESRAARETLVEYALDDPGATPHWLTHGTATDRQPVFSPDGAWLAFSSNRSGNLDIWEVSTRTGTLRRLTEHEADDWDPGFTRDGRLIWSSGRTGHLEIWTAEPDGGSPRKVSSDGADAENPTSTPDGWVVYASSNSGKQGLWKVRLDGSGAVRFGRCDNVPETSPDGTVVGCPDVNVGPLRFTRLDGTPLPFVIDVAPRRGTEVSMGRMRWSPDGRKVYFVAQDERGVNGIFEQAFDPARADTSATRRKVAAFDSGFEAESFAISPDGKRLVVAALERTYGIVLVEGVTSASRR